MRDSEARSGGERVRRLMMGVMDGEASAEERAELKRMLDADTTLQSEWNELMKVKEVTSAMAFRKPPEEVWSEYWTSLYSRLERGVGWILVSLGAIVLISYGAYKGVLELIADVTIPWFIKAAVLAAVIGVVVLLVSVIREKIFIGRAQPYKDIER